jgi:hypothetical protein
MSGRPSGNRTQDERREASLDESVDLVFSLSVVPMYEKNAIQEIRPPRLTWEYVPAS